MANTLDLMDLKKILTLHLDGLSNRKTGDMPGIHRNTINAYLQHFNASKFSKEEFLTKDNEELLKLFPSHTTIKNPRYDELMSYFEKMNQQRDHPGFLLHYIEYRLQSKEHHSYTQFMEHYHRKFSKEKDSMKLEHKPDHEVYTDFTGKKLQIINRETG